MSKRFIFGMIILSILNCGSVEKKDGESQLKKLTKNIYYMPHKDRTDRPLLAVISGENESLVVDAGNSPAHARSFLSAVEKLPLSKPKYLVITHWHWDHVFGISTMNLMTITHEKTKEKLEEMNKLRWDDQSLDQRVKEGTEIEFCSSMMKLELTNKEREQLVIGLPNRAFSDKRVLDLGGLHCIIEHVGGDHSDDSTVVYVPEEKVLFLGDCMYAAFYSGPPSFSRGKLFPLLDKLLGYGAEYYIDGHREPMSKEEMNKRCHELKKIGNLVGEEVDIEPATARFKKAFGKDPDEGERYLIEVFIEGNKKIMKNL